jgi:hypothetical protein
MREIKFRAWVVNGDYSEMLPNVQNHIGAATGFGHLLQNTAKGIERSYVMQYTGLKDKNGVEIYEKCEINGKYHIGHNGVDYILIDISLKDIVCRLSEFVEENGIDDLEVTREYAPLEED